MTGGYEIPISGNHIANLVLYHSVPPAKSPSSADCGLEENASVNHGIWFAIKSSRVYTTASTHGYRIRLSPRVLGHPRTPQTQLQRFQTHTWHNKTNCALVSPSSEIVPSLDPPALRDGALLDELSLICRNASCSCLTASLIAKVFVEALVSRGRLMIL